jgi:two-component system invasion response regulator UvrY
MPIQILIVDDHQIVREGVRRLLDVVRPEWSITEAQDASQALELLKTYTPNLVIMDITMPGFSGLEAVSILRKSGFNPPVLIFTMHKSTQLGNDTRGAGAQGYVLKSQAVEDLVRAIDALLAGGTFFGAPSPAFVAQDKPNPGAMFSVGFKLAFA